MNIHIVVYNGVISDTRVIKTAKSLAQSGHIVTVFGFSKSYRTLHLCDNVNIVLVPYPHRDFQVNSFSVQINKLFDDNISPSFFSILHNLRAQFILFFKYLYFFTKRSLCLCRYVPSFINYSVNSIFGDHYSFTKSSTLKRASLFFNSIFNYNILSFIIKNTFRRISFITNPRRTITLITSNVRHYLMCLCRLFVVFRFLIPYLVLNPLSLFSTRYWSLFANSNIYFFLAQRCLVTVLKQSQPADMLYINDVWMLPIACDLYSNYRLIHYDAHELYQYLCAPISKLQYSKNVHNFFLKFCTSFSSVNPMITDIYINEYPLLSSKRVFTIYNSVYLRIKLDRPKLLSTAAFILLNLPPSTNILLYQGGISTSRVCIKLFR